MAKKSTLWSEVEGISGKGEVPVIKLSKGAKVIVRRPPGRPRTKPHGASHYYNWIMKTPSGVAMRCRNPSCDKKLRSNQEDIVCGDACREVLRRYCEVTLEVLDGKIRAREYPPDLRGLKNALRRRAA